MHCVVLPCPRTSLLWRSTSTICWFSINSWCVYLIFTPLKFPRSFSSRLWHGCWTSCWVTCDCMILGLILLFLQTLKNSVTPTGVWLQPQLSYWYEQMNRPCIMRADACSNLLLSWMQWHGICKCETWATGHLGRTTMPIQDASKTSGSGKILPDAVAVLSCQIARKMLSLGKHTASLLWNTTIVSTHHTIVLVVNGPWKTLERTTLCVLLHNCLHYLHLLLTVLQDILGTTFLLLLLKHLLCPSSPDLQNCHSFPVPCSALLILCWFS